MLKSGIKKPKQERSQSTVNAILEAVTHVMDREGPLGLTTNKIAEKAGVSVGSLYQYFKNKESIYEAILLRMTEHNVGVFEKSLSSLNSEIGIRTIVDMVVRGHFENIQKMGKITSVLFEYAPQVLSPAHFKKSDERIIRFLIEKAEQYHIEIRSQNREHAFFVCSQAVRAVIFMTFLQKPEHERESIMNELIDMLSTYLEKPKS